jgi:hypothetical protein
VIVHLYRCTSCKAIHALTDEERAKQIEFETTHGAAEHSETPARLSCHGILKPFVQFAAELAR